MAAQRITVNASSGPYTVHVERGALGQAGVLLDGLQEPASRLFLLSSPRVWRHWGKALAAGLKGAAQARAILFNDAEAGKNLRTVEQIARTLAQSGADRKSVIVAAGGGVVGDVAGFVAASYARGIRVVHVPTTLVAQVDSAIGGKTGVNLPEGKNLVGAFHQPSLVIVDPQLLRTLPPREFRSGLYEVIKYGIIGDEKLFATLEQGMVSLVNQEAGALEHVIQRCVEAKARIVSEDEREAGLRMILNFGHTTAHALESTTRYRRFLHGEAVGWGMIAAIRLSVAMKLVEPEAAKRMEALIGAAGKLPRLPAVSRARFLEAMRTDKKAEHGRIRFVLTEGVGRTRMASDVPEDLVAQALSSLRTGGRVNRR